jgi:hypothetical protein
MGFLLGATPLHAQTTVVDPVLLAVIGLAALGSAVLLGLGLAAYVRRRSRPYLLVVLALAAIAARSAVAWVTMLGMLPDATHHLVEHGLDVVMTALVVGAVWYARSLRQGPGVDQ